MQFLTLSRRRAELSCDIDFHRRVEAEACLVSDLRQAGIIRQIWQRGDAPGTCLLIEAPNESAARAVLEVSPLIRTGMLEIDTIVPLRSYDNRQGRTSPPITIYENTPNDRSPRTE